MPGCRGLANSRRFAERISTPHFTTPKGVAICSLASTCGLASIYDYVHFVSRSDVSVPACFPSNTLYLPFAVHKAFLFRCYCMKFSSYVASVYLQSPPSVGFIFLFLSLTLRA
ncbi:hypothetical protein DM02DRAFT_401712 [Periconia macrospinosa]|uniref:Uncharacterized protein n=1 Tax=Periconia macrospinosa TaxID=97972 RepID=A0A2V1CYL6_9PLEO|nr:hypothetical protein DM02DRAFT_401712 [Periconia macrospinosa]